ncbi:hypothetical protein EI42_04982 [Thermosporothrix hazakensis]|jgi:hypothetical protein|uniref:Uncharacterized protein n=2 Tax=Thermosporothrix hazakensis TaxID=644383 RepID=A0A326U9J5_THEHA|nr:hypothetical protein [Thermosporothrix hazakensis]PZW23599.1 hypothetical protein EI42_04982 [Thermosporothrix hazakensis]GCE51034.1 hypothetical protein KTH_59030 [Thermosporothrix hazakensis]
MYDFYLNDLRCGIEKNAGKRDFRMLFLKCIFPFLVALLLAFALTERVGADSGAPVRFCELSLAPVEPGQTESAIQRFSCVDSPSVADEHRIWLLDLYQHTHYGGKVLHVTGTVNACQQHASYALSSLPVESNGFRWDKTISSFKLAPQHDCLYTALYEQSQLRGTCFYYKGNVPLVSSRLNDRIASLQLSADTPVTCSPAPL